MLTYSVQWKPGQREWLREAIAEFFGTFMLVFLGNNAVAEKVLSGGKGGSVATVNAGYGIAAFVGVLVSVGVSGAHINPAVTIASAFVKKLEWSKVPHYVISHYLGGFAAACCTYLLYMDGFQAAHGPDGPDLSTAGIFATYPRDGLSISGGFIDQILGTFVLVAGVYAITDSRNAGVPLYLVPFYVAVLIFGIGSSIGFNEGYAINPARDFAPRFFTYVTFWGDQVFQQSSFWYIPIIGPHIGAILGASVYVILIEKMRDSEGDHADDIKSNSSTRVIADKKMSLESITVPEAYYKKASISSGQGEFPL